MNFRTVLPTPIRAVRSIFAVLLLSAVTPISLFAEVISWWRFETDDDPGVNTLSNPNEIAGEPALVSSNAVLGTEQPDLFDTMVPGTEMATSNAASVRSAVNGSGNDGIFGQASYSPTLDVESITVEFWVRTTENEAGFVARTTADEADVGEGGSISDGFKIYDPNNVSVDFWTHQGYRRNGNGRRPIESTISSGVSINDGNWNYIAFLYSSETERADLVVNDDIFSLDLTGLRGRNRELYWGDDLGTESSPTVYAGHRLDGNPNNQTGTLDEIRFTDYQDENPILMPPAVPEPRQIILAVGCLLAALGYTFRRQRAAESSN